MPFDELLRAALDDTVAGVRGPLEGALRAFGEALWQEAAAEREQQQREAAEAAAAAREQSQAQIAAIQHTADQQIAEARRDAQQQVDEARRAFAADVEAARRDAAVEMARIQQEADAAIADLRERSAADAAALRARTDAEIEDARRTAEAQVEDVQRTLDERLSSSRRELDESRRQADEAGGMLEAARSTADALRLDLEAARAEILELRARASGDRHETQLLHGIRSIDQARTLGEVLDGVVGLPRPDGERVAVFIVKGDRLQAWRSGRSGPDAGSERGEPSMAETGALMEAIRTGSPARGAFPITIGGAVVAVLHADAPALDHDVRREALLEVVARHASRVLEAITIQRAAGLLPPAGAVSHAAAARAGRSPQ